MIIAGHEIEIALAGTTTRTAMRKLITNDDCIVANGDDLDVGKVVASKEGVETKLKPGSIEQ